MNARILLVVAATLLPASVAVAQEATATLTANAATYFASGGNVTLTATVVYPLPDSLPSAIAYDVQLPPGWKFVSMAGASAAASPAVGDNFLEFAFSNFPVDQLQFTIVASYTVGLTGNQTITVPVAQYREPPAVLTNMTVPSVVLTAAPNTPPSFAATGATQPSSLTKGFGLQAKFTATAIGTPAPTYQWRKGGVAILGATDATYTIASVIWADAGSYDVVATSTGGTDTSTSATLTVTKGSQAITFGAITAKTFGDPAFTLGATITSPLTITYASSNTGVATVTGNTVTLVGRGTAVITASQAGNDDYNAATSKTQTLTVNRAAATVTLDTPTLAQTYTGAPSVVTATTTPPNIPVVFTYDGSTSAPTNVGGPYAVVGTINSNNYVATPATGQLFIAKANQTVTFNPLPTKSVDSNTFQLVAASSSGLPVAFTTSNPSLGTVATISGNTVTLVSPGTITITASQSGDSNYNAATSVDRVLTVLNQSQIITFAPAQLSAKTFGDVPFSISAASNRGLLVGFANSNTSVATVGASTLAGGVTSATVTIIAAGSTNITASQLGDNNTAQADDVVRQLTIAKKAATVALGNLTATYDGTPKATTVTTVPIGLTVNITYAVDTGTPSATAPTNAGSYIVVATVQDANYQGTASGTLTVQRPSAITSQPANRTVNQGQSASFTVTASGYPAPTYQWRKDGVNIGGNTSATTATLSLGTVQASDAGSYDVVITNVAGSVTSLGAALFVNVPPAFTTHPTSAVVTTGDNVTFTATATGTPAPTYQWRKNGANIAGATASTYTIAVVAVSHSGSYDVVATNAAGSATSNVATLTVNVPPAITTQPQNLSVTAAQSALFTVVATGTPEPTYQWRKDGTTMSGKTNASFTISGTQPGDAGSYDVVVTNIAGTVTSNAVTLTVNIPPTLFQVPASLSVTQGQPASFSVLASGSPPPVYQWRKGGTNIPGATNATLEFASAQVGDTGTYEVVVSNIAGALVSPAVTLTVNVPPAITAQPANRTVLVGQALTLTVAATGSPAPSYQWRRNGGAIAGATTASFARSSAVVSDAGEYDVVVVNVAGTVTSNVAIVTVNAPPVITAQPVAVTVTAGQAANFSVTATGTPAPTYQWRKNGTNISGATSASLAFSAAQATDAGSYDVVVSNVAGVATSNAAVLTVNVPPVITTQPVSATVNAGQPTFALTVVATGSPAPTYQWLKDGVNLPGGTGATLAFPGVAAADAGRYRVVISNVAGAVTSNEITLTVNLPPAITTPPVTIAVGIGTSMAFSVSASGTPSLSYQWSKDGTVIAGATTASLPLANVSFSSAGAYRVTVSNMVGSVTSYPAWLAIVDAVPAHSVAGPGYVTGGSVIISNTLTFSSTTAGVGWLVLLPAGWSYLSGGNGEGDVKPLVGTTGLLEWAWSYVPASPITFSYTLSVPAGASGDVQLAALAVVRQVGVVAQITAKPDPLVVSQITTHSADTDRDFRLSLLELTRVIELYNTRNGTTRTGCYILQTGTEDGFAPDPSRASSTLVNFAAYHAADSNRDGKISLLELTRVIELASSGLIVR